MKPEYLLSQSEPDVRATMQEEDCMKCFGCPHATINAAVISMMAHSTYDTVVELGDIAEKLEILREDPSDYIAHRVALSEDIQEEYREKMRALTKPCVGWHNGIGGKAVPRPAEMCNSPQSGDPKISIAAGWLLEKLTLFRSR